MSGYDVRGYSDVGGEDVSGLPGQMAEQAGRVALRLRSVGTVTAVTSGKGGVGKSFVAATLAAALAASGRRVGLLDADLDGPTAGAMLGAGRQALEVAEDGVRPAATRAGVRLMSTGLLLEEEAPLTWRDADGEGWVWRGAQERGVLREFLSDVAWGELDRLVVDLPPGTARLEQLLGLVPEPGGLVAVTLPSAASGASVRRSLRVAAQRGAPVLGVVENMSGYACRACGAPGPLFPGRAGEELAEEFGVPLLGRVPFDPAAAGAADDGDPEAVLASRAGGVLREVAGALAGGGGGA